MSEPPEPFGDERRRLAVPVGFFLAVDAVESDGFPAGFDGFAAGESADLSGAWSVLLLAGLPGAVPPVDVAAGESSSVSFDDPGVVVPALDDVVWLPAVLAVPELSAGLVRDAEGPGEEEP